MNRAKWHACPRTTLKYKSSAEHLSCLCIWSFLPLSSIQLTTGCWKVLSAISLSVITTVALCSDPGLSWRARGHVPFHNAASSPCSRARCSFVKRMMFCCRFPAFLVAVSDRKGWAKRKGRVTSVKGSAQSFEVKNVHLSWCQKSLTCWVWKVCWHLSWSCWRDIDTSYCSRVFSDLHFFGALLHYLLIPFYLLMCCPCFAVCAPQSWKGMTCCWYSSWRTYCTEIQFKNYIWNGNVIKLLPI